MSEAHVICCNDSVEHVVVGTKEAARLKLRILADAYYKRMGGDAHWRPEMRWSNAETPYEAFRQRCYWHIHTVPMETL